MANACGRTIRDAVERLSLKSWDGQVVVPTRIKSMPKKYIPPPLEGFFNNTFFLSRFIDNIKDYCFSLLEIAKMKMMQKSINVTHRMLHVLYAQLCRFRRTDFVQHRVQLLLCDPARREDLDYWTFKNSYTRLVVIVLHICWANTLIWLHFRFYRFSKSDQSILWTSLVFFLRFTFVFSVIVWWYLSRIASTVNSTYNTLDMQYCNRDNIIKCHIAFTYRYTSAVNVIKNCWIIGTRDQTLRFRTLCWYVILCTCYI